MSALEIWLLIIGLTLITQLMRSTFLMFGDRFRLPERVQHGLRYAPVCALIALITPELFVNQGALDISMSNPKLVAGIVAALSTLVLRSMIATIAIGMLVFATLRMLA
ncbi:MAG: AzlD domain-containing protein [Burkholderiaceae bacterium]|nr:AzlD domain-containing protein [Burkholderiaceae bacterium]